MSEVEIPIICHTNTVPLYATQGASGADVQAHLQDSITLQPGEIGCIPTGIQFEIPEGYEIQVRPRSGLALKGITVVNTPGTIDSDYRGELKVILINHSKKPFIIEPKMRIAQIVVCKVERGVWVEKEELSMTLRASSGFGHTGLK